MLIIYSVLPYILRCICYGRCVPLPTLRTLCAHRAVYNILRAQVFTALYIMGAYHLPRRQYAVFMTPGAEKCVGLHVFVDFP